MIMLASTLLCSKFSKRCYMTMGPFRPRRNTTITHHHRNPFRLANLSGTGCNGGHAVVTLHPWCTKPPSWQPASVNSHHQSCQGTWLPKLEIETYLALRSSWMLHHLTVKKFPKFPGVCQFFWFPEDKNPKTNNLLEISTNLRDKKTISHILRLFFGICHPSYCTHRIASPRLTNSISFPSKLQQLKKAKTNIKRYQMTIAIHFL